MSGPDRRRTRAPTPRTRRHALGLLAALLVPGAALGASDGEPTRRRAKVPGFSIEDAAGRSWTPADLRRAPTVLEWTSPACAISVSRYALGTIPELQRAYASRGVQWLTVFSSPPGADGHLCVADAARWLESHRARPTAVLLDEDGALARAFQVVSTPTVVLVATSGEIAFRGALDDARSVRQEDVAAARSHVREALEPLLRGAWPESDYAAPVGCAIPSAVATAGTRVCAPDGTRA